MSTNYPSLSHLFTPPKYSSLIPSTSNAQLSTVESEAVETLIKHFDDLVNGSGEIITSDSDLSLPVPAASVGSPKVGNGDLKGKGKFTVREKMFLSRETMIRYLKATNYNIPLSQSKIEDTIRWRRTYCGCGVDNVEAMSKLLAKEAASGAKIVLSFSRRQEPIFMLSLRRSDTIPTQERVMHSVYIMERAIDLLPATSPLASGGVAGQPQIMVILDLTPPQKYPPSLTLSKSHIEVLGGHYPERLGMANIWKMGWMMKGLLTAVWPFLDVKTRSKLRFDSNLVKDGLVDAECLLPDFGGTLKFKHDSNYYQALNEFCLNRRAEQERKFLEKGEIIGMSESEWRAV